MHLPKILLDSGRRLHYIMICNLQMVLRTEVIMRTETSRHLALALVFIGLALPVGAQNVTIELTPITYPIVIPDSGGSFDYLLTVTNQGGTPITATVWCMATLPGGGSWGPVLGPATRTLGAGQTQSYFRTQTVPPRSPYGYYALRAYIGIYPGTVWAQDQFEFQRQGISGTEQEWVARYYGPGNGEDAASSLAIDAAGNVYVTGHGWGNQTWDDYATIKYDASGNQIWVSRYDGPGRYVDEAYSLAVDGGGNVYVTGYSTGSRTGYDYATIKYDASGNQIWATRYNGPMNASDKAYSLAVDGGNVYVTGHSWGGGTNYDYATVKYDTSGNELWVARFNGPENNEDIAYSLAVDGGGNVYVTGYYCYGSGFPYNYGYATVKYDASGNQIWVAFYNGPEGADKATSIAVDGGGNVYVTGYSTESGGGDYATIKYDANGNELWVARYDGQGGYYGDVATSLAVDGGGNVYVTGWSFGTYIYDYATVKYNGQGNQIWVSRYNGVGTGSNEAYSLAVDACGNVYVTGLSEDDYATIKYDASGNRLWAARYNGPGNDYDEATSLAVDGGGNVYVTGKSHGGGTYYDYATIKYSGGNIDNWMPVEATVFGQPLPQECRLEQNFPDPFNATTVLRFELSVANHVKLGVYDISGRLVETLVDGWRQAGTHELTFDASHLPSGMYVYRIQAGEFQASGKMVLLK